MTIEMWRRFSKYTSPKPIKKTRNFANMLKRVRYPLDQLIRSWLNIVINQILVAFLQTRRTIGRMTSHRKFWFSSENTLTKELWLIFFAISRWERLAKSAPYERVKMIWLSMLSFIENGLAEGGRILFSQITLSPKIPEEAKAWIIETWWAIWNPRNDFIFSGKRSIKKKKKTINSVWDICNVGMNGNVECMLSKKPDYKCYGRLQ